MDGVSVNMETSALGPIDLVRLARAQLLLQAGPKKSSPAANSKVAQAEIAHEIAPAAFAVAAPAPIQQVFQNTSVAADRIHKGSKSLRTYAAAFAIATLAGLAAVWNGNQIYGPEMYGRNGMAPAAMAHAQGLNYAVFDLNLNVRALREAQIERMEKAPDVVIIGASQFQEGNRDIMPGVNFFNSHIHRDYWEDLLGMVNLYVKHDRLPKTFIIAIRDLQFTPVDKRKDFLWEPGIPSYREMSQRLGIEPESYVKTLPYERIRALFSFPMLFDNLTRWYNATEWPGASSQHQFDSLDTLSPDGSIVWSRKHKALFTPERTKNEVAALVKMRANSPPEVDQQGVAAFDKELDFLKERGVEVYLIHPPYNPLFHDAIQGTPFAEGVARIDALTQEIADRHGLKVLGSFNPHKIGCEASMYIDAEHSSADCLKKLFAPFVAEQLSKKSAQ